MKAKYAIVPFVPAVLVMLFFKLMGLFGADGNDSFMGMNKMNITYLVIAIALGLFLVCILINLFDRKTAPVYPVKRNPLAGFLSILTGLAVMACSITAASNAWMTDSSDTEKVLLAVICAVFSVPAGLSFALISRVHFSGKSEVSNLSIIYVFPSLWGCAELVTQFLQATKASIYSKDLTALFCYIFIALYFFTNSMVVSRIKGRNPVKGLFVYGLPMAALSLTYGVYEFLRMSREGFDREGVLFAAMFVCAALYALSFIIEVFTNTYTKDEIEIVDGIGDEDDDEAFVAETNTASAPVPAKAEKRPVAEKKRAEKPVKPEPVIEQPVEEAVEQPVQNSDDSLIGDLVFSERGNDKNPNVEFDDDYYSSAKGMDDFIIGYDYESGKRGHKSSKKKDKSEKKAEKKQENEVKKEEQKKAAEPEALSNQEKLEKELENKGFNDSKAKEDLVAMSNKQSVEAILSAKSKRNAQQAPAADSTNVQKLTEELRKAAQTRKGAVAVNGVPEKENNVEENLFSEEQIAAKKAEDERIALQVKKVEEARKLAAQKKAEEAAKAEAAKRAEEAKKAEEARRAEKARKAEEARRAEEARKAEEARRAEEARKAEEARRAEEARKAEEARRAEEAKKAEAVKQAAPSEEIDKAEAVRRAVEERKAEEARRIAAAKQADEERRAAQAAELSDRENAIAQGEERYREKLSEVDELLKKLGDQK